MKSFFKYWIPVLLWAEVIFFIASQPADALPHIFFGQDILFHIFEYALLALLLNRALKNSRINFSSRLSRLITAILFCLVYAILDEMYQQFSPGRNSSVLDVILDSIGIVIGSTLYRW